MTPRMKSRKPADSRRALCLAGALIGLSVALGACKHTTDVATTAGVPDDYRLRHPIAEYLVAERKLGRLGEFDVDAVLSMIMGPAIMLGFTELVGGVPRDVLVTRLPDVIRTLIKGIAPTS